MTLEPDMARLYAAAEIAGVGAPFDECLKCGRFIPNDEPHISGLMTPPESRTAAVISLCGEGCKMLLEGDGWRKSTREESDRLKHEIVAYGQRQEDWTRPTE